MFFKLGAKRSEEALALAGRTKAKALDSNYVKQFMV
jgi:hypothetical protein